MDREEELRSLEEIAGDSWYARGVAAASVAYCARIFRRFFRGGRCLEMGPAEGLMTELLHRHFSELAIVEGSETFAEALRERFPDAQVKHALFEAYEPEGRFDTIVLGHVLEHVADPVALLRQVGAWLAPGGVLCACVPNAQSIHRQAAVVMGLLEHEHQLNEADLHHGHRRVYDPESFRADFVRAGLTVETFGGYWLKPVSNVQIDADWTPEMIDAFMKLGERYPDVAAEIYVIATRPGAP